MAQAAIKSYELYQHDLVTVGIDIYNIEPEAFGCEVSKADDGSIPGIKSHPYANKKDFDPDRIPVPRVGPSNRLGLITEASRRVYEAIGDQVWIYACMSGPFSQAVELRGFEQLIMDTIENPELVHRLLERTTELAKEQARRLSEVGCGINLYESWATIPLITPELFGEYVVPYNRRVIDMVKSDYHTEAPAVIMGGNINLLIDFFLDVGTSLIAVDYKADFDLIKSKTIDTDVIIRGCVDPKLIERGGWDELRESIGKLADKSRDMCNFVWGCGCVTCDTSVEDLLTFRRMCLHTTV
jgi:uroporphyrinogen decarboxylase